MSDATTTYGGPGLPTLLGITFIVLKLTGVINWSWIWVLSPIWIPLVIFILFAIFLLVASITEKY